MEINKITEYLGQLDSDTLKEFISEDYLFNKYYFEQLSPSSIKKSIVNQFTLDYLLWQTNSSSTT